MMMALLSNGRRWRWVAMEAMAGDDSGVSAKCDQCRFDPRTGSDHSLCRQTMLLQGIGDGGRWMPAAMVGDAMEMQERRLR